MARPRLVWQLYPTYLIIALVSLLVVGLFAAGSVERVLERQAAIGLERQAAVLRELLTDESRTIDPPTADSLAAVVGELTGYQIVIMTRSGRPVGFSGGAPSELPRLADMPEIITALGGAVGVESRRDPIVGKRMIYCALPIGDDQGLIGVIRAGVETTAIEQSMSQVYWQLGLGSVGMILLVSLVSLYVARRLARPLELIRQGAALVAKGDLTYRLPVADSEEIGSLAEAINFMSAELADRIRIVTQQRNEQEAILASMIEGVVAVDGGDRLINLNRTAGTLLNVRPEQALGRPIHEVVRNSQLLRLLEKTRGSTGPVEEEIVMTTPRREEIFLQAHGSPLLDSESKPLGVVLVFNDVTRIRRLENVRREFVANVSHELRTPLTSVKGYLETIIDGGIDSPEDQRRFLGVIARQVDRLNAIIEDLLSLSRIEQRVERAQIDLSPGSVAEVCRGAVRERADMAAERNVVLECDFDDEQTTIPMNPSLLQQALVNLIDNAIKYGPEDSIVRITSRRDGHFLTISVSDRGPGIPEEHRERIFERFYRVDKGRSRESGGTGLGLAIVKHIALAHRGAVTVESGPEVGTSFSIRLPLAVRRQAS